MIERKAMINQDIPWCHSRKLYQNHLWWLELETGFRNPCHCHHYRIIDLSLEAVKKLRLLVLQGERNNSNQFRVQILLVIPLITSTFLWARIIPPRAQAWVFHTINTSVFFTNLSLALVENMLNSPTTYVTFPTSKQSSSLHFLCWMI